MHQENFYSFMSSYLLSEIENLKTPTIKTKKTPIKAGKKPVIKSIEVEEIKDGGIF